MDTCTCGHEHEEHFEGGDEPCEIYGCPCPGYFMHPPFVDRSVIVGRKRIRLRLWYTPLAVRRRARALRRRHL